MGLIDFVKSAGQKIFGGAEASAEEQADKIYQYLRTYNLRTEGINASYDKDTSTIRVIGKAGSMLERKRIVATLGNIEGVEHVDDQIQVVEENNDSEAGSDNVRYYEVKSGDTLSAIAEEMYGDANKYHKIFDANTPMLSDPDKIYPGQKLVIPADK